MRILAPYSRLKGWSVAAFLTFLGALGSAQPTSAEPEPHDAVIGVVYSRVGKAMSGAVVTLDVLRPTLTWKGALWRVKGRVAAVECDVDGRYTITLSRGCASSSEWYALSATGTGHALDARAIRLNASTSGPLYVAFTLQGTVKLVGRVLNPDGTACRDALVFGQSTVWPDEDLPGPYQGVIKFGYVPTLGGLFADREQPVHRMYPLVVQRSSTDGRFTLHGLESGCQLRICAMQFEPCPARVCSQVVLDSGMEDRSRLLELQFP